MRLPAPSSLSDSFYTAASPLRVLEISSGNGQHAAFLSTSMPVPTWWQPSDWNADGFRSIRAFTASLAHVAGPIVLDASAGTGGAIAWGLPPASFDVVFNANMIHIAPWPCAVVRAHWPLPTLCSF